MELDGREDETFDLPAVSILAGTTLNPCIFLYSWCRDPTEPYSPNVQRARRLASGLFGGSQLQ